MARPKSKQIINLKATIERAGITQSVVADALGVRPQYISNVCRGKLGMSEKQQKKIRELFKKMSIDVVEYS